MITETLKKQIVDALADRRKNFTSDAKLANNLGINTAQLSRIQKGELSGVLSDANWISLARQLDLNIKGRKPWVTAETPVYTYITKQLRKCQNNSLSLLLCDAADIGKTFTARAYVKNNRNAVYVDCSQVKSKQKLLRQIAKEFGLNHTGKYADVYADFVFYVNNHIVNPIIILDEAGDLDYSAFLELKALWNATEGNCGWFMMGADGLKEKVRRAIDNKKVGYTEIFSRYGKKYARVTPDGKEESDKFTMTQAALIIRANAPTGADTQKLLARTEGSLRRIYTEISKLQ